MRSAIIIVLVLIVVPALAQQPPTVESVTAEANSALRALRTQRDEANDRIVRAQIEIDRLTKELEAAKAARQEQK